MTCSPVPFDEVSSIMGRSAVAARQLASRARLCVRGASQGTGSDPARQREVVTAFLAASGEGNFDALMAVLNPKVVLHADGEAVWMEAAGAVWAPGGRPRVVFGFKVLDGKIVEINLLADPERLRQLQVIPQDG